MPTLAGTLFAVLVALAMSATAALGAPEAICSTAAVIFCDNFEDRNTGSADLATSKGTKTPG